MPDWVALIPQGQALHYGLLDAPEENQECRPAKHVLLCANGNPFACVYYILFYWQETEHLSYLMAQKSNSQNAMEQIMEADA